MSMSAPDLPHDDDDSPNRFQELIKEILITSQNMADKERLISELRQRIEKLPPLEDEPNFNTSEDTLTRFLKSRDWKLEEAERMLTDSIEYRRRTRPLTVDCSWCHNRPGYHSMVGHDQLGRPVIYSCFAQATTHKNTAEDSVMHVTYLIENAKRTMPTDAFAWVFVIDCTGMTLSSCNPKLGYGVTNVLSNHYPERLGLVVCVNHSPVFHGVWKAIKQFLHPHTASKVRLVRAKAKIEELFSQLFDPELSTWLREEIALNKQKPLSKQQVEFWNPPASDGKSHDPRGCPSYVRQYVDTFSKSCCDSDATNTATPKMHRPHPNIVDKVSGRDVAAIALSKEEEQERLREQTMVEAETDSGEGVSDGEVDELDLQLNISDDKEIPGAAVPLAASS